MNINLNEKYKKLLVVLGICVAVFTVIFVSFFISETCNAQKFYQGVEFYNKQDYQNSYYNFKRVAFTSKYYPLALLEQARCAENLGDKETVLEKYELFASKYPKSAFSAIALYKIAQIYFENKKYEKSEKIFRKLEKNFPYSEYAIAGNYYLGEYYKDKIPTLSKKFYIKYLKKSPTGKFASDICSNLLQFEYLSASDYQYIAYSYLKNGDYVNAFNFFQKAFLNDNWHNLVIASAKLRRTPQLKFYFECGMKNYSYYIPQSELNEAINTYVQYFGGKKENWESILNFISENNTQGEDFALYRYSKFVPKENKEVIYSRIYSKYPDGDFASDALWNLFWIYYQKGFYKKAEKLALEHLVKYPNTNATPQIMFWLGKIYKYNLKDSQKAEKYFNRVIKEYPDNYYAFRASALMDITSKSWHTQKNNFIPDEYFEVNVPVNLLKLSAFDKKLISGISKIKDYELLEELRLNDKFADSWINLQKGKFATSATFARDALNELTVKPAFDNSAYKLAYPLYYADKINNFAQKNKLDSYLITALIREESYFNKYAQSSVGARGLMQLMPDTALFIAQKNNITFSGLNSLFNESKNIEMGTAYFKYIKSQLNKNDLYAVAAYNGGPGSVLSWRKNLKYNDFDEFIENIPYKETQDYVKKVYRSYWNYSNIYK